MNGFGGKYSLASMHCGQMEFNKLTLPVSNITINGSQSIQKEEEAIGNGRTNEHSNMCIDIKTEVREED
jgi:hypothetical protein